MQKKIEKALEDAGLSERQVTPFMRVRVVGLNNKRHGTSCPREGLITIWNPTEKQVLLNLSTATIIKTKINLSLTFLTYWRAFNNIFSIVSAAT